MAQQTIRPYRRSAAHAKTSGPRPGDRAAARPGPGWPYPDADHPSWPAGTTGADWPPRGTDHPSWPAGAMDASWPYADAVRVAERILADADRQAAQIRREASAQAAAIRVAAEHEAAELRAHLLAMSAELGRVAAYITENLTRPVIPATKPAAQPATAPVAEPAAEPGTKRRAQPVARPQARPRQFFVMRRIVAAATALVLFALTAGITEIALHGFQFFVFRQGGTGSTPGRVINDKQFLAREHHKVTAHHPVKAHGKPKEGHKAKTGHHRNANNTK